MRVISGMFTKSLLFRKLALVMLSSLLASGLIVSATAEEVSVTIEVEESVDPATQCIETEPEWSPYVRGTDLIPATPGEAANFQIDPDFSFGDGFVDGVCGTPIAPTGLVSAQISLTGNPSGWGATVECIDSCPASDFIEDQQDINFIDASVTPPNAFGDAYSQNVVVTLTWTP